MHPLAINPYNRSRGKNINIKTIIKLAAIILASGFGCTEIRKNICKVQHNNFNGPMKKCKRIDDNQFNPLHRHSFTTNFRNTRKPLQVEISGIAGPIANLKIDARVVYNPDKTIRFWRAEILPTKIDPNSPKIVLLSNEQPFSKPAQETDELEVKLSNEKIVKAFIPKNPQEHIEYTLIYEAGSPLPKEFPEVLRLNLVKQKINLKNA